MLDLTEIEKDYLDKFFSDFSISSKTILVLGSTSFVGINLVRVMNYLVEKKVFFNCKVILQIRNRKKLTSSLLEKISNCNSFEFLELDYKGLEEISDMKIDYLFNFLNFNDNNIPSDQLLKNFDIYASISKFFNNNEINHHLFTSSGAAYGLNKKFIESNKLSFGIDQRNFYYGISKAILENLYSEFNFKSNVSVRLFSFCGPYMNYKSLAVGQMIKSIYSNIPFTMNNSGNVERSFMFSTEMAARILKLNFSNIQNQVINLGSEKKISLQNLYLLLCEIKNHEPNLVLKNEINVDDFYVPNNFKANNILESDEYFDLKTTLILTLKYYENEKSF